MLEEMIMALKNAKTPAERETAYRNLERVGMDRTTANVLLADMEDDE